MPIDTSRLRGLARRSVEVGLADPRRWLAGAATLPWVLGRGASLASLCQIHAWSAPGRTAVLDRHGALSWWQLNQRVNRLARALDRLGVVPGDEVALVLRNGREFCETFLAAQRYGAVAAPLNTWSQGREIGAILHRQQPAMLVYDTRNAEQLDGNVPVSTRLVHVGPDGDALAGSQAYEQLLADHRSGPVSPITTDRGTTRILIHTSGTTGVPKAAARDTGGREASGLLAVLEVVPFRHDDVLYVPNPMFHSLGVLAFAVGLATGATLVLPDRFDPRQALDDLARHRATAASFVPVMLRRMLALDDPPQVDLSHLRIALVAGSAVPPELRRRVRERFGDVLYDLYGTTEAGWVSIATPQVIRDVPDAVGRPVPGVDVAILDDTGSPLPTGQQGVIGVRSGATFEGYTSGETSDVHGEYLSTGDLGCLDEQGYLHVVGRADDMVVVGGENVYPDEVEAVIEELEGVREVAVVGVEDDDLGQVLVAFVAGAVDPDQVQRACERDLPSYKVPRRVQLVDELPRTATGKVRRHELAERSV